MPQPFNNAIMTNSGARLLTRAQAGEIKIQFTRMAVGSGTYTEAEKELLSLQARTRLKAEKNSYPLNDITVFSDHSVRMTALVTNADPVSGNTLINNGYYINEMGVYAKAKDAADSTEVLYSIAVVSGEAGDFMPPYNGYYPVQIIQDYFATVNNSAQVTIKNNSAVLLREEFERQMNALKAELMLRMQVSYDQENEALVFGNGAVSDVHMEQIAKLAAKIAVDDVEAGIGSATASDIKKLF